MFNSTVLDVAVGLVFVFLAISLIVSAIVEAIASVLKWRSATLLSGIKELLNDPNFDGLALKIYNHALVNPRDRGSAKTEEDLKHPPAYIDPKQFAGALIEIVEMGKQSPETSKAMIDANARDKQLNAFLKGVLNRAGGDPDRMRAEIASWFDNSMDRISGVYKRRTQIWSFAVALLLAAILNISSTDIGKALWQQPMLVRTIAPTAGLRPAQALEQMEALGTPLGWTQEKFKRLPSLSGIDTLFGWLITAAATLFGAPFWFDALEQIVRLKGSGPSPAEKRSNSGAAA
jgi:hypothetical protein